MDQADEDRRTALVEAKNEDIAHAQNVMVAALLAGAGFAVLSTMLFVLDAQPKERSAASRFCTAGPGQIGAACQVRF